MGNSSGPTPCEILIVGEAPSKSDAILGKPFTGTDGKELRRMLQQAGFEAGLDEANFGRIDYARQHVRFTNVFDSSPPEGKIENFCGTRAEVGKSYSLPPFSTGKYFLPERAVPALNSLADEIHACQPKLILALGNTATWALLRRTGITKLRGSLFPNELVDHPAPVLPSFHPSAVLRRWGDRPIAVGDFQKAKRYLEEGSTRLSRQLHLEPTLQDIRDFCDEWIFDNRPPLLSFDIETAGETITCIGFATSTGRAITIPFYDQRKPDRNYWASAQEELAALRIVHRVLASDIPKLGQNGLYDIQYCIRYMLPVRNYLHDTMIRHHSLYPEMEKGLGFMATLYTDEAPWKLLRNRNRDNFKIDDE